MNPPRLIAAHLLLAPQPELIGAPANYLIDFLSPCHRQSTVGFFGRPLTLPPTISKLAASLDTNGQPLGEFMPIQLFEVTLRWLGPAIAATVVAHLALYFRNRNGNHVVVYRASERSRLRLSDLSLVKLLSEDQDLDLDNLVLNELRIVNNSDGPIDDLSLSVRLTASKGPLEFWVSHLADPLGQMKCEKGENSLNLTRDFINSRSSFKEESIRLRILSNTKLDFSVRGGGRNWLAKFEDRSLPEKHAARIWLGAVLGIILSVVVFALSSSTYFQGSAILASLGVLAIAFDTAIVVVLTWMIRRSRNSREE